MQVLALGGSGLVGRYATRTLLELSPEVELTIADRELHVRFGRRFA